MDALTKAAEAVRAVHVLAAAIVGIVAILINPFGFLKTGSASAVQTSGSNSPVVSGFFNKVTIVSKPEEIRKVEDEIRKEPSPSPGPEQDSFPYIVPNINLRADGDEVHFTVQTGSRSKKQIPAPIEFISGEITDTQAYAELVKKLGRPPVGDESWRTKRWVQGGRLPPGGVRFDTHQYFSDKKGWEPLKLPPNVSSRKFQFEYISNSGKYSEELVLKKVGVQWLTNMKLWIQKQGAKTELLLSTSEF